MLLKRLFPLILVLICAVALVVSAVRTVALGRPADVFACETGISPGRDIALLDARASLLHPLTRTPADDYAPDWNAAGTRLTFREFVSRRLDILHALELGAFTFERWVGVDTREDAIARANWEAGGAAHAFTLGYGQMWQGGASDAVAPVGYGFRPTLSPDGQWVLYYADTPDDLNAEVYAFNPETRERVNLSQHPAHDWNPVWSPDGRQIAFVSTRDGNPEIYVTPFACAQAGRCASDARRLTVSAGSDVDPTWAPDGQRLAFVHEQRREAQLMAADLRTGDAVALWPPGDDCRAPAWKP